MKNNTSKYNSEDKGESQARSDQIRAGKALITLSHRTLYKTPTMSALAYHLAQQLSYRDVEELLGERGVHADHVTVWRWVQRYAPELQRRLRRHLKPTNHSWRLDETYVRVKGKWRYLYRAVDSTGAALDFLLSAKQDAAAAKRFLAKALGGANHPAPRVINTDGHAAYPPAVAQLKAEGALAEDCRHRPVPYLNNTLEQDQRAIKRRGNAGEHFRF